MSFMLIIPNDKIFVVRGHLNTCAIVKITAIHDPCTPSRKSQSLDHFDSPAVAKLYHKKEKRSTKNHQSCSYRLAYKQQISSPWQLDKLQESMAISCQTLAILSHNQNLYRFS